MSDRWSILCADDDEEWLSLAREDFKSAADWELTTASSLADVQRLINEERNFDVVLVDLGLGGSVRNWTPVSGYEAAKLLQETGAKVGLFSAQDSSESRNIARQLAAPFFDKGSITSFIGMAEQTLNYPNLTRRERGR